MAGLNSEKENNRSEEEAGHGGLLYTCLNTDFALKIRERFLQALGPIDLRRPMQEGSGLRDIGLANLRIVRQLRDQAIIHIAERPGANLIKPALSLNFPIALRGQTIGAVTIEDDKQQRTFTEDENAIIQGVIQQMTLALENQRLADVAQQAAQRDRAIAAAADKIHRPTDLDAVLQTAVEEISRIMGTGDVRIRLGVEPQGNGNGSKDHAA